MPRPSRNLDRALIIAGQALYPHTGCSGLTIRQVADAAGVNIGMFHYHFRTREAFLQAVMQATYEEMFAGMPQVPAKIAQSADVSPREVLRAGLQRLGRFAGEHRAFLGRVLVDSMGGESIAREFLATNFPRHLELIGSLIQAAQAAGELRAMPVPQAIAFCAGAITLPVLGLGAAIDTGSFSKARAKALGTAVLSRAAIDERIELVLVALSQPETPRKKARS